MRHIRTGYRTTVTIGVNLHRGNAGKIDLAAVAASFPNAVGNGINNSM
jgi:hypothetical protein